MGRMWPQILIVASAAGGVGYLVGRSEPAPAGPPRAEQRERVAEDAWLHDDDEPVDTEVPAASADDSLQPPLPLSQQPAVETEGLALREGDVILLPTMGYIARADGKGGLKLKKHGPWTEQWKHGVRAEGEYRDGKKHGAWRSWFKDGKPHHTSEWLAGKKVGIHRGWHKTGELSYEHRYEQGRGHGLWKWWHRKGTILRAGAMEEGRRFGTWTVWHADGGVSWQGDYLNGKAEGEWRKTHRNGKRVG